MAKTSSKDNVVPMPLPTVEQAKAALAKTEQDWRDAEALHHAAVDAAYAVGNWDTPQLIEARRQVNGALARQLEAIGAVHRAEQRAIVADIEAQKQKDEENYRAALAMTPRLLELAEPVGFTRGANLEVLKEFVDHGWKMLGTLGRRTPHGAVQNLQQDLVANAAMIPLPDDDPSIKPGQPRNFVDRVEISLTWWFGITREAVKQLRDSAAAGGK